MTRKITTLLIAMFIGVSAFAQMSDDAVYQYVQDGLAKGKTQTELVNELAKRGVTKTQAERIKARLEESHGTTESITAAGEQETDRRTHSTMNDVEAGNVDMISTKLAEKTGEKNIYGRSIFTTRNLNFAPSENLPTPENYKLGPGDEIIIDIWGTNQTTIRQTISPEGYVNISDIGLVYLNGMTIKEADKYMRRQLGRIYSVDGAESESEIKLTLGKIRTIQINIMGEVSAPGTYYLSSFANMYHALYRAGGVGSLGSLRNIQLIRGGKIVNKIDMYDFLLKGRALEDVTLQEGDIIMVGQYEELVDITGKVKRPMYYEMKKGEKVSDILEYCGGFTGDAYRENVRLVRQNGKEYQVYTIDADQVESFELMDGDAITVGAMLDRFENKVELKGAVYRPGVYQISPEICTVRQLIEKADGLMGDAFMNRGIIYRLRDDLTNEVIAFDLKGVMNGTAPDINLLKDDIVSVSSIHDLKDIGTITVFGEVAQPGSFAYAENTSLMDAIMMCGGLLESASYVNVEVCRRVKDPNSTDTPEIIGETFNFNIDNEYDLTGAGNFKLKPYDQIYVRRSPGYMPQATVMISGEITFPGTYSLTKKSERLSDLIKKAGGVTQWAYVKGARMQRRATPEERSRMIQTRDMLAFARDSISVEKLEISGLFFVGIDLEKALANPGSDADIVLREGDNILIPEYLNTVKISGNVMCPNVVTYDPKQTLKQYVNLAGGYGNRAKRSKVYVVNINGNISRVHALAKDKITPGCEIIVPERKKREGNALQSIMSLATTSASLGTMIATIGNLLK